MDRVHIGVVQRDHDDLVLKVPCAAESGKTRQVRWLLHPRDRDLLVLGRLHVPDLDHYLGSRKQRRAYLAYLALFRAAREWVLQRDAREAPVRDALATAACAAQLPAAADTDALQRAITVACATYRGANRGTLPVPNEPGWAKHRDALYALLHATLAGNAGMWAAAVAAAARIGAPLRLACDGRGRWHLYTATPAAERDARVPAWPWVNAYIARCDAKGGLHVQPQAPTLLRRQPGEVIIVEADGIDAATVRVAPTSTSVELLQHLDALEPGIADARVPAGADALRRLLECGIAWSRRQPGHYIVRPALRLPVGIATLGKITEHADFQRREGHSTFSASISSRGPVVLFAEWRDLWSWALQHWPADQKADARALEGRIIRRFANESHARDSLAVPEPVVPDLTYAPAMSVRALDPAGDAMLDLRRHDFPVPRRGPPTFGGPAREYPLYVGPAWDDIAQAGEALLALPENAHSCPCVVVHSLNKLGRQWFPWLPRNGVVTSDAVQPRGGAPAADAE
ncbi:MAG TPA: hypothetical protein VFQ88_09490 [Nevskiaceae bacterium]|nr:hypothetical protein [Nevskiaceae bacterium]